MTTTPDSKARSSQTPTYDANGLQVYKPEVGVYHRPALTKRDSFGGVIGALQDVAVAGGSTTKAYPENWAGIIAAIKDLQIVAEGGPGADTGDKPPGLEIIINPDTGLPEYIWPEGEPENGTLWFDTRQGRLFVWQDDDFYQTNGADGLPIVTQNANPPGVQYIVPGQFWWDAMHNSLYIFDGTYEDDFGNISNNPQAGRPVWKLVADIDEAFMQTTGTLPLTVIGPRISQYQSDNPLSLLPDIDLLQFSVQKDYNEWIFQALLSLEEHTLQDTVQISETPPTDDVVPGSLWYDSSTLELSIYYDDGDSQQWVPVSVGYSLDEAVAPIQTQLDEEISERKTAIDAIYAALHNLNISDNAAMKAVRKDIVVLQDAVDELNTAEVDLSSVTPKTDFNTLTSRVATLENTPAPNLTPYAKTSYVDYAIGSLTSVVNAQSESILEGIVPLIPNVSSFVEQSDIDASIANITTEYLPRTGGTLTGSFVIEKEDVGLPAFDVSASNSNSRQLFKLKSYNSADKTTNFGATNNWWEVAWNFSGDEDFAWVYNDTNKVFSINKYGAACSQLVIGDFAENTQNGRQMTGNTIDVGERLAKYEQAFADLATAIGNSTDFLSLKNNLFTVLTNV